MKLFFARLFAVAITLFSAFGFAHEGEPLIPQHGGLMATANDLIFELTAEHDGLVLYVDDHGTAFDVTGATAKVTVLNGGKKQVATLVPDNGRLRARGTYGLEAGSKAIAIVELPGLGKQTLRFTVP